MMRLGLVSGGVDILRTTEDFFGWHGLYRTEAMSGTNRILFVPDGVSTRY